MVRKKTLAWKELTVDEFSYLKWSNIGWMQRNQEKEGMGDGKHKERSKKTKGLRFVNEFIEFIDSSDEDEVLIF